MKKEVRITMIFGFLSALSTAQFCSHLQITSGWPVGCGFFLLVSLMIYSIILCGLSKTPLRSILFPLLLLLGVAILPDGSIGFMAISLGIFSWIRSGICYPGAPFRSITTEAATLGGAVCAFIWLPNAPSVLPLTFWLFFLFQSLYFYLVPDNITQHQPAPSEDTFERARREVERLLEGS